MVESPDVDVQSNEECDDSNRNQQRAELEAHALILLGRRGWLPRQAAGASWTFPARACSESPTVDSRPSLAANRHRGSSRLFAMRSHLERDSNDRRTTPAPA